MIGSNVGLNSSRLASVRVTIIFKGVHASLVFSLFFGTVPSGLRLNFLMVSSSGLPRTLSDKQTMNAYIHFFKAKSVAKSVRGCHCAWRLKSRDSARILGIFTETGLRLFRKKTQGITIIIPMIISLNNNFK